MKNRELAQLLNNMGTLLEIKGELIFKIRAYFKAAENISNLAEDIETVMEQGRLSEIPGVGKTLQAKIEEWLATGKMSAYEKLIVDVPETLLDVVAIQSLGPKKAKLFYDEANVRSVEDLKKALDSGALLELPTIKEKTLDNIRKGIELFEAGQQRLNLAVASRIADNIIQSLKDQGVVKQIEVAGSLRRCCETIGDIDLLAQASDSQKIMDCFVHLPAVQKVNAHGPTKSSVMVSVSGEGKFASQRQVQVDLRVVDPQCFGAALAYFTGSKSFNIKIRQHAIKRSMKISEYGVFKIEGKKEKIVAAKTEKDCFQSLDLPYVEPEIREENGLETIFSGKKLPRLITEKDIVGEFHVHSTWSDGRHSIEEMVQAAQAKGYRFLAISDHSAKLKIARGVSAKDLLKKKEEITKLDKKFKDFKVLIGSEVEIDSEGNLDYNDDILSQLDIVIGAIHTGFEQTSAQLTKRLIKAIENPNVNIIAHPTGVHLGKRDPYDMDFKAVCEAAVANNVFLEINSFPIRLDLNSNNVFFARQMGVKFVINTDSHRREHLDYMPLGVSIARRGWLTKEDVLNTRDWNDIKKLLKK
jgi:DNA polymerase (family 10)